MEGANEIASKRSFQTLIEQDRVKGFMVIGRNTSGNERFLGVHDGVDGGARRFELAAHQGDAEWVVVGQQEPHATEDLWHDGGIGLPRARQIKHKVERGTMAEFAFDVDRAAHQGHELAANRETEAGTAEATRDRAIGLSEFLEQLRTNFGGDAGPIVDHLESYRRTRVVAVFACDLERDRAFPCELGRITEQVEENLAEPPGIADQCIGYAWLNEQRDLVLALHGTR